MQDMIISAVSEYGYDKLKYWVNSIKMSGFKGRVAVIAFNIKDETFNKLRDEGVEVYLTTDKRNASNDGYLFAEGLTFQVPMLRHYFYWSVLSQLKDIRYVISTDISDVVFQSNPSEWLEQNLGNKKLNYGCEGLKYKDEAWGNQNMAECFPQLYHHMKNRPIYNAGSMAGEFDMFKDYSLAVSLAINNVQHPTPDQAGVNVMLSIEPYHSLTKFNDHDTNWACECGTTVDPNKINSFRPFLLSPEPYFDEEYAYTSKGEKYVMVHQYNRVPEWKEKIERKYG